MALRVLNPWWSPVVLVVPTEIIFHCDSSLWRIAVRCLWLSCLPASRAVVARALPDELVARGALSVCRQINPLIQMKFLFSTLSVYRSLRYIDKAVGKVRVRLFGKLVVEVIDFLCSSYVATTTSLFMSWYSMAHLLHHLLLFLSLQARAWGRRILMKVLHCAFTQMRLGSLLWFVVEVSSMLGMSFHMCVTKRLEFK